MCQTVLRPRGRGREQRALPAYEKPPVLRVDVYCSLPLFQVLYPGIRLPRNGSLKITDFDTLPHLFQNLGQFLHQVHLDVEIDGKVGILVRRIDGLAHIEIDIGGFLKQQAADEGRAVLTVAPVLIVFVFTDIVFGVFNDPVDGNDALGHQVDPFQVGDGRDIPCEIQ